MLPTSSWVLLGILSSSASPTCSWSLSKTCHMPIVSYAWRVIGPILVPTVGPIQSTRSDPLMILLDSCWKLRSKDLSVHRSWWQQCPLSMPFFHTKKIERLLNKLSAGAGRPPSLLASSEAFVHLSIVHCKIAFHMLALPRHTLGRAISHARRELNFVQPPLTCQHTAESAHNTL